MQFAVTVQRGIEIKTLSAILHYLSYNNTEYKLESFMIRHGTVEVNTFRV